MRSEPRTLRRGRNPSPGRAAGATRPLPPGEVAHRLDRRGLSLLSSATERAHAPDSAAHDRHRHLAPVQGERRPGACRRAAAVGARQGQARLHRQARRAPPPRCRSSRRCATRRATSRTTRSPISTSTSRNTRRRSTASGGAGAFRPRLPRRRGTIILSICRAAGARTVTKGKSMIAEEIGLNDHLEAGGIAPVETDLGEYIIQLRARDAAPHHRARRCTSPRRRSSRISGGCTRTLDPGRDLSEPVKLLGEARTVLRERFLAADVGITGREFPDRRDRHLDHRHERGQRRSDADPAEDAHRPRLDREARADAGGRGADPARARPLGDRAGHVGLHDLLDRPAPPGGPRRAASATTSSSSTTAAPPCSAPVSGHAALHSMCGACMNHCPVYQAVGGHAYGWVYPGPMGAVLTPTLIGVDKAGHLAQRLDFLRTLRERLPGPHPAAQADAPLARARVRAPSHAGDDPLRHRALGVFRPAAGALPVCDANRRRGAWTARPLAGALRMAAASRGWTQSPRLSGAARRRPSRRAGSVSAAPGTAHDHRPRPTSSRASAARSPSSGDERTRLQIVAERLDRAPKGRRSRRAARARARPSSRSSARQAEAALATVRVGRLCRGGAARGRRVSCATTICPRRCGWATIRGSRRCRGARPRSRCRRAVATAATSTRSATPSAASPRAAPLVMVSGPENPSTLNFLPDNHIVVIAAKDIAGDYETSVRQASRHLWQGPACRAR